ncbi:glucose-6-phosphate isomerase protein [Rhizobium sp. N324]|nr:glucose-6-phosphate isomerase protein [Rhizobium sp. N324]OYD01931.1 glucose-6-phosphate isomerase protein [Rhizobium sp. N4311]
MLLPEGVLINGLTGGVSPGTGRYTKRLSELREIFQDQTELDRLVEVECDPVVYEVIEYRKQGSDLFFGTTTMEPGKVSGEFFMTRGHFHQRRDMGEVYYTEWPRGPFARVPRRRNKSGPDGPGRLRLHSTGLGPPINQCRH